MNRNFLAAAIEVLRSADRPLTTSEITSIAISHGLLSTKGKTPAATMSAALYARGDAVAKAGIVREFEAGRARARRGSVRWRISSR